MAVSLHLYFGLKAAFEFKGEVDVVNGDALDQLSDQPFVVIRHRLLLVLQKGFELVQPLLHSDAVSIFQKQSLFLAPELFNFLSQIIKSLLSIGLLSSSFCSSSRQASCFLNNSTSAGEKRATVFEN